MDYFPVAEIGELKYDDEWLQAIGSYRSYFKGYLEGIGERDPYHYNHPGLNLRYGLELEFLGSANRYIIGNRVNSCMYNQNGLWWGKNFNALGPIDTNLATSRKPLTDSRDGIDEWSSFFLEVSEEHGASSYKGDTSCANRGTSGFRIESDGSVEIDNYGPGISLYSVNKQDRHANTDLKGVDTNKWNEDARGLKNEYVDSNYNLVSPVCSSHTLKDDYEWNVDNDDESALNLDQYNELVSNILTNVHVKYPSARVNGVIREGYLPLGSLAVDNILNHMLSHQIVIATQRMGFHVHLSEFPFVGGSINSYDRQIMIIGFVKLFYLFEPLIFSFFPAYRYASDYCQSLQSVFTKDEMLSDYDYIWDDLVNGNDIDGVNRKIRGLRYLSLNLQNCATDDGIGTIEIRLGHSTFDSTFIQAYVNILQSLFRLNMSFLKSDIVSGSDIHATHDYLLNQNYVVPYYCEQSSANYNQSRADFGRIDSYNQGAPIFGFFSHCGNYEDDKNYKTSIIENLIELFVSLTGAGDAMSHLIPYIEEYHMTNNSWLSEESMNYTDLQTILNHTNYKYSAYAHAHNEIYDKNFNSFFVVNKNAYGIRADGKYNLLNACKTCTKTQGRCVEDYNDFAYPIQLTRTRGSSGYRDQKRIYADICNGKKTQHGKSQTELINYKILYGSQMAGGGRMKIKKTKKNRKSKKQRTVKRGGRMTVPINRVNLNLMGPNRMQHKEEMSNTRASMKEVPMTLIENRKVSSIVLSKEESVDKVKKQRDNFMKYYHVNKGAERISVMEEKGSLIVGYGDWLGGFTPEKGLTTIVNTLINTKVISRELLDILLKHRYIDYYVFTIDTEIHKKKLVEELGRLKITPETIEKIRKVYRDVKPMNKKISTQRNSK